MSETFQVPNPRDAKRRGAPRMGEHWRAYPITVAIIAICILVGVVSRLGQDTGRIQFLYFAGQGKMNEALLKEEYLKLMKDSGEFANTDLQTKSLEELENTMESLSEIQAAKLQAVLLQHLQQPKSSLAQIKRGQVWRLFTPMFIHFGIVHIFFNLLWFWELGRSLELRYGSFRFGLLVAVISLAANVTQALLVSPWFGGMSGVVYGLFGFAYVRQKIHPSGDILLNPHTVQWMFLWLVICFTGAVGPIANGAHVAGLLAGAVIGWADAMKAGGWKRMQRRNRFRAAMTKNDPYFHQCAVCRRTERDGADLEFRVGLDGQEYCTDHLPRNRAD